MKLFKAVNDTTNLHLQAEPENARSGILIVDDSRFSRNILKDILKNEGYLVVGEAGDGLEAIEMAKEKRPEYIFMDVEMPKLDGLGAIPKILEIDPEVHIIMCTALGQKKIIVEAAKAGAKDYVIKPYKKENIMGVMSVISNTHQKDGQVIPFKAGKKHTEELNIEDLRIEEQKSFAYEDVQDTADSKEYEILPESDIADEEEMTPTDTAADDDEVHTDEKFPDISIDMEEFIEPLDSSMQAKSNSANAHMDSSLESEKLKAEIEKYMQDTFDEDEISADKNSPERDSTTSVFEISDVGDTAYQKTKQNKEIPPIDTGSAVMDDIEVAKPEILNDIFEVSDVTKEMELSEPEPFATEPEESFAAEPEPFSRKPEPFATAPEEDAPVMQEDQYQFDMQNSENDKQEEYPNYNQDLVPQDKPVIQEEKKINNQIADPDLPYSYLWSDRFSSDLGEIVFHNSGKNRVSFSQCASLENDTYTLLGGDNEERKVMLGMISAYMSMENRLQQKGTSIPFGAKMSSYTGGGRIFAGSILKDEKNEPAEICLMDAVRLYSNGVPKSSHENLKSTGFYLAVTDLVQEKANRMF